MEHNRKSPETIQPSETQKSFRNSAAMAATGPCDDGEQEFAGEGLAIKSMIFNTKKKWYGQH